MSHIGDLTKAAAEVIPWSNFPVIESSITPASAAQLRGPSTPNRAQQVSPIYAIGGGPRRLLGHGTFKDFVDLTMQKSAAEMVRKTTMVPRHTDHCPHCDHEFTEKGYPRPRLPDDDDEREKVYDSGDYDEYCPECDGIIDQEDMSDNEIQNIAKMFGGEPDQNMVAKYNTRRDNQRKRRGLREKSASAKCFCRPENSASVEKAKHYELYAGANDWELANTWVWADLPDYRNDADRVWFQVKFPEGASCEDDYDPKTTDRAAHDVATAKGKAHGERAPKVWVVTAKKCMQAKRAETPYGSGPFSRHNWKEGLEAALSHEDMKPYVDVHGVMRSEFREKGAGHIAAPIDANSLLPTLNRLSVVELLPKKDQRVKSASIASAIRKARKDTDNHATEKEIKAGNYKKGRISIRGVHIAIENPKDSFRRGTSAAGKAWETRMTADYGYFTNGSGTTPIAVDGDEVDAFIGPDLDSDLVVVVDQYFGGKYDESKFILCVNSQKQGEDLYLSNYQKGWKLGPTSTTTIPQLKEWLKDGDHTKPFKGQMVKVARVLSYLGLATFSGMGYRSLS